MLCELFNFSLLKHCECIIHVFQPYVFIEHCVNDVRAWMNANVCACMCLRVCMCVVCVYIRVCVRLCVKVCQC